MTGKISSLSFPERRREEKKDSEKLKTTYKHKERENPLSGSRNVGIRAGRTKVAKGRTDIRKGRDGRTESTEGVKSQSHKHKRGSDDNHQKDEDEGMDIVDHGLRNHTPIDADRHYRLRVDDSAELANHVFGGYVQADDFHTTGGRTGAATENADHKDKHPQEMMPREIITSGES